MKCQCQDHDCSVCKGACSEEATHQLTNTAEDTTVWFCEGCTDEALEGEQFRAEEDFDIREY